MEETKVTAPAQGDRCAECGHDFDGHIRVIEQTSIAYHTFAPAQPPASDALCAGCDATVRMCREWRKGGAVACCPDCNGTHEKPAPASERITYACQFCRVLEPEEHKPDCFVFTVTQLRADLAREKERADYLEKINASQADQIAVIYAREERLEEALREIAEWGCPESECGDEMSRIAAAALEEGKNG